MALTGYAEDLAAINRYFLSFNPSTLPTKAATLRADWIRWYGTLGWWDVNINKENWYEGRRRRDDFNVARGVPPVAGGAISEEMYPDGIPGSGISNAGSAVGSAASSVGSGVGTGLTIALPILAIGGIIYLTKK